MTQDTTTRVEHKIIGGFFCPSCEQYTASYHYQHGVSYFFCPNCKWHKHLS